MTSSYPRTQSPCGWSYGGNVTDSIKEKVKRAGGNVTGKLRVSLSWFNHDDLDLHVFEPNGDHIWYKDKRNKLDVDMNAGGPFPREPVENVTWTGKLPDGEYRIEVNQFNKRESTEVGFVIETESNGKIEHYSHERAVGHKETVVPGSAVRPRLQLHGPQLCGRQGDHDRRPAPPHQHPVLIPYPNIRKRLP